MLAIAGWHWLLCGLAVLGMLGAAFYGLDRLCLWLEHRGWLYYRKNKPSSSPTSAWVAMQRFLEPGAKHVVELSRERSNEDEEAGRDRLLSNLLASLDATPVNLEEVRIYLAIAKGKGIDWRDLYNEAVRVQLAARPDRAPIIPPLEDVIPQE
jgi:hypothetical protein